MQIFSRGLILSYLFFSLNAFALQPEKDTIHFNTKVELSGQPATILEVGEATSSRTAFYIGALLPNSTAQTYEEDDFGLELQARVQRVYLRTDYFFNGTYESGFFAGGFLSYTDTQITNEDDTIDEEYKGAGGGVHAGYLYRFDSLTVGATLMAQGFSYDTIQKKSDDEIAGLTEDLVLPHHESASVSFNFGYTF